MKQFPIKMITEIQNYHFIKKKQILIIVKFNTNLDPLTKFHLISWIIIKIIYVVNCLRMQIKEKSFSLEFRLLIHLQKNILQTTVENFSIVQKIRSNTLLRENIMLCNLERYLFLLDRKLQPKRLTVINKLIVYFIKNQGLKK
ncbi:unnamed protein product [Paramecium octaurelia]|uniref:Uncharacterized protein n=1 Tax=Paramecium octaurelia TaxID=43137 RepID=A0A8S1S3J2_PAROT|nr:unnamed protein product [Paramecium octaurelia]